MSRCLPIIIFALNFWYSACTAGSFSSRLPRTRAKISSEDLECLARLIRSSKGRRCLRVWFDVSQLLWLLQIVPWGQYSWAGHLTAVLKYMARALIREMIGMRSWLGTRVHALVRKEAMLRYYYGVEEHKSL